MNFSDYCLKCDMREEMRKKISWKVFAWIIGGIMLIAGSIFAIGASVAIESGKLIIENSKEQLEAIHALKTEQSVMAEQIDHLVNGE